MKSKCKWKLNWEDKPTGKTATLKPNPAYYMARARSQHRIKNIIHLKAA